MAEARQRVEWSQAVAVMRSISLAMNGREPPLVVLVPARFRPRYEVPKPEKIDPELNRQRIASMFSGGK